MGIELAVTIENGNTIHPNCISEQNKEAKQSANQDTITPKMGQRPCGPDIKNMKWNCRGQTNSHKL